MVTWTSCAAWGGDEHWNVMYRIEVAALSEGLCPVHGISLEAVAAPARRIAGHCTPCGRFWGYNRDAERVGWWLDHDPWHPEWFSVAVPGFMEWISEP